MALLGLVVLAGAFMLGLVALVVVLSLGLLAGLGLWLRMAWIRRQLRQQGFTEPGVQARERPGQAEVIEAEYTVIKRHRDP
jgi:hypothetical protein